MERTIKESPLLRLRNRLLEWGIAPLLSRDNVPHNRQQSYNISQLSTLFNKFVPPTQNPNLKRNYFHNQAGDQRIGQLQPILDSRNV